MKRVPLILLALWAVSATVQGQQMRNPGGCDPENVRRAREEVRFGHFPGNAIGSLASMFTVARCVPHMITRDGLESGIHARVSPFRPLALGLPVPAAVAIATLQCAP